MRYLDKDLTTIHTALKNNEVTCKELIEESINEIKKYVDIAVVGSYITNNDNYNQAINNLKN